jgi:hypothetical protein
MPTISIIKLIYILETFIYNSIYIYIIDALLAKSIKHIIKEFKDV